MRPGAAPRYGTLGALLLALVLIAGPAPASANAGAATDTVDVHVRVWQDVSDPLRLFISARPAGGRWDTLGTIPLLWDGRSNGFGEMAQHRFGDITVGGVNLRIWQRSREPTRIYVQVCGDCPPRVRGVWLLWRPLGKVPLPLDDGRTASGRYRYGDLDIAVPSNNPGLLADREHLLALRDVLEGETAELDWDAGTPTAEWEGIALGGAPPRVTELNLPIRGLTGEIWGWLGDLTELTLLNLSGNRLTGSIPSKLQLLQNLTHVYLAGNDLEGCIPPGLWRATHHDLDYLELPACGTPAWVGSAATPAARGATYRALFFADWPSGPYTYVLDLPAWQSARMGVHIGSATTHNPGSILKANLFGIALGIGSGDETWLFLEMDTLDEMERSHYSGCIYDCGRWKSPAARIEQLAASIWVNWAALPPRTSTELVNAIDGEGSDTWEWRWP